MSLTRRSATKLLSDLNTGKLTAVELMQATLAQIEKVNPQVNAIVALRDADELMAEAAAADQAVSRGPLHGLPIAVKDLDDVAGIVSSQGSPIFANHVPEKDSLLAQRMRDAGAILIAKTNVPEFGLGSHSFNPVYGVTCNPYDVSVSAGGSSGGAAVALVTGMTALADGSDRWAVCEILRRGTTSMGLDPVSGVFRLTQKVIVSCINCQRTARWPAAPKISRSCLM